jgi:trans-2,3-dihydro-3-hydroxyanthranilate isomerase
MNNPRRGFLKFGAASLLSSVAAPLSAGESRPRGRAYGFVQIDVFSSKRLQGNALAVFLDGRGLSDAEMQDLARETNLQETTFVIPRDAAIEREQGVKVRIFIPSQEIAFGGHPTLGTAMVLRDRLGTRPSASRIVLDLQVGKIPVDFSTDAAGHSYGEMHQVDPLFAESHDRNVVAALAGVRPEDIVENVPIQSVSTGLSFAIVPLKSLKALQSIKPDLQKIREYFGPSKALADFYYVTRDTQDPNTAIRSRAIYLDGEDPATGSASGCLAAWMVRYGVAKSGEKIHIEQGAEIKRPSQIFASAEKVADKVQNVRVGGNAVEVLQGEYSL